MAPTPIDVGISTTTTTGILNYIFSPITASTTITSTSMTDIISVAQGSSGVWFASGNLTIFSSGTPDSFVQLWDGTTTIASGATNVAGSNFYTSLSISGILASPAGNIRLSGFVNTAGASKWVAIRNITGLAADSALTVVRIG